MTADLVDIHVPCFPGSLTRSAQLYGTGRFRISRRTCELYSVQILSAGSFGRARVTDGTGRAIWYQPSTFTGSFQLGAGCVDGIIAELYASEGINFTLNFREADEAIL